MLMKISAVAWLLAGGVSAAAQSPSTGSVLVVVVDQTGGVVKGAQVTLTNTSTAASRAVMSNETGAATFPTLPLTGEYKISVAKQGFTADDVPGLKLRAGETATIKVRLVATGGRSDVTVFGTTEGVRADPQIGKRLDS